MIWSQKKMTSTTICGFIQELDIGTSLLDIDVYKNLSLISLNTQQESVSRLNRITYAYITPIIITVGVIGDILTVATLTHPLLRRSSIIYTYLTLLAMTDLVSWFEGVLGWIFEVLQ